MPTNLSPVSPWPSSLGPPQAAQVRLPLFVKVQAGQSQESGGLVETLAELLGAFEPQAEQARLPPLLFSVHAGHCHGGRLGVAEVAHPNSDPFLAAIISLFV